MMSRVFVAGMLLCSGCSLIIGPATFGDSDGGPRDAGVDAGLDAGLTDAGPRDDAGPQDGGLDSGVDAGADPDPDGGIDGGSIMDGGIDAGPPLGPVRITVGSSFSCTYRQNGTVVYCWGNNDNGQLGDGTERSRNAPVMVEYTFRPLVEVSAGGGFACALETGGRVVCWGRNDSGQLGAGSTATLDFATVLGVGSEPELTDVVDVECGEATSCAVLAGGQVACWGSNIFGEVGNPSTTDRTVARPVLVSDVGTTSPLENVTQVSVGAVHACARRGGGSVACWGSASFGRLGNGSTSGTHVRDFVRGVGGTGSLSDIEEVRAGFDVSCARDTSGGVLCWGANDHGQLGNGGSETSAVPVRVSSMSAAIGLTTHRSATCALRSDGTARCWGENSSWGILGNKTTADARTPVTVQRAGSSSPLQPIAEIDIGALHACVLVPEATCWGSNLDGRLGIADSVLSGSFDPRSVVGLPW